MVRTRLLQHVVKVAGRAQEPSRVGRRPRGVGVGVDDRARRDDIEYGLHALDVVMRIEPDLHLQASVAVAHIARGAVSHGLRPPLRDRAVQRNRLPVTPAQQLGQGHASRDTCGVPRRHVERRLGVRMSGEVVIDGRRERDVLARIDPKHQRREKP
jgi:hypothetical protein